MYCDISPYPSSLSNLSLFHCPDEIWFLLRPPPTFLIDVIKFFWRLPYLYINEKNFVFSSWYENNYVESNPDSPARQSPAGAPSHWPRRLGAGTRPPCCSWSSPGPGSGEPSLASSDHPRQDLPTHKSIPNHCQLSLSSRGMKEMMMTRTHLRVLVRQRLITQGREAEKWITLDTAAREQRADLSLRRRRGREATTLPTRIKQNVTSFREDSSYLSQVSAHLLHLFKVPEEHRINNSDLDV